MDTLLTNKTASTTELRDTNKLIEESNGRPVAILNRNNVIGYFVPVAAVEKVNWKYATSNEVKAAMDEVLNEYAGVIEELKDK